MSKNIVPERVWVLGAGFSRSLGAPLLPELLSLSGRYDLEAHYPDQLSLWGDETWKVYGLYYFGLRDRTQLPPLHRLGLSIDDHESLWEDAEEFLDYLERAVSHAARTRRIRGALHRLAVHLSKIDYVGRLENAALDELSSEIRSICGTARRVVAARCCSFLKELTAEEILADEKWIPYVRWAGQLGYRDTVVTFNYDRVLDWLVDPSLGVRAGRLSVITDAFVENRALEGDCARVLKLHGSVDWKLLAEKPSDWRTWQFAGTNNPEYALTCPPEEIAVATPGPGKAGQAQHFDELWAKAEHALSIAKEIYFIGYRFPSTDAQARNRLLDAIAANKGDPPPVVYTVLGHNPIDSERLLELMRLVKLPGTRASALRAEEFLRSESAGRRFDWSDLR